MKIKVFLASAAAVALAAVNAAAAPLGFRAPHVQPQLVTLPVPKAVEAAPNTPEGGRLHVGDVRALAKSVAIGRWEPVDGGYVARLRASSPTAQGLRVRLDLGTLPGVVEVRAQGSGNTIVERHEVDPRAGTESWTPWTEGEAQLVEVFSPVRPASEAIHVGAVVHFNTSPFAKAAASCTLSTACSTGEAALDAAIAERKRSLMRINFQSGGRSYVCSATLIDTPQRPVAYVLTANHCIATAAEAASITSLWFYEQGSCNGSNGSGTQASGGMQVVFANYNVDTSLLRMNQAPPANASYAPLDPGLVASNTQVVSLSHPDGDSSRWAEGLMEGQYRPSAIDVPYNMYFVRFSRGMVQGGSSGSGGFTRVNGGLALTGVLSLGPLNGSCDDGGPRYGVYGRLEAFYPQISQYIGVTSQAADDAPNRPADVTTDVSAGTLDNLAQPLRITRQIDYPGDVDIFRFTISAPAAVTIHTDGSLDLVGTLLDANGVALEANDDAQTLDNNAGITRYLQPGAYYAHIAHWVPSGTGAYGLTFRADRVDPNYTALWWDETESGWGLNLNHQGNILFGTLFTYDDDGAPLWLVMSNGNRQPDGSYSGTLRRTTGPAFNSVPWGAYGQVDVGTMRLQFHGTEDATLRYGVNGRQVVKSVRRMSFKTPPECSWSHFDRTWQDNLTDLWWNDAEPGWGINLVQQQNTVFATLFTYGPDGRDLWLLMSGGSVDSAGRVTGELYRTTGPRFDATNWNATPIQYTRVGTMTLDVENGNRATLTYTVNGASVTKSINRGVFATPKTKCVQ